MGQFNGEKKGQKTQIQPANQRRNRNVASECDRRSGSVGANAQSVREIGASSQDWIRRNCSKFLLGGILAQLIEDTQSQLGDAQECIAREQMKIATLERRLKNLQQLQTVQEENSN